jgi:Protein of unknown function (DUF4232)
VNDDSYEARRVRELLDAELAGLSARPEALQRILVAGRAAASGESTQTSPEDRRRAGGRSPARLPIWVVAAAAVVVVAVALAAVRSLIEHGGPASPAGRPPSPSLVPAPPPRTAGPTPSSGPRSTRSPTVTGAVTAPPSPDGGASATPPSSASSGLPRCEGPALQVVLGPSQGAAGTLFYPLIFRNVGDRPCALRGFPGVTAADASGTGKLDAARDRSTPSALVVLAKGAAAHAVLAVGDVATSSDGCPTYPRLLVTPPDSRLTTTVAVSLPVCAQDMRISVVQPGSGP